MDYSMIFIVGAVTVPFVFGLSFLLRRLDRKTHENQQNQPKKDNQNKK